jgi:hypothetical protein
MDESLSPLEEATLRALAEKCNYSIHAHVQIETALRGLPSHLKGDAKKALDKLRRKGYCQAHPTGRSTTYQLTELGLVTALAFRRT